MTGIAASDSLTQYPPTLRSRPVRHLDDPALRAWDEWLRALGREAGFCQSSDWIAIDRAVNGAEHYLVEVLAVDGAYLGGALFSRRQNARTPIIRLAERAVGPLGGELTCFEGPVLPSAERGQVLGLILDEAERIAARADSRFVRFQGPPAAAAWAESDDVHRLMASRGYTGTEWCTALVDLAVDDAELFRSFRGAARKGVKRCQALGIEVHENLTADAFEERFSRPYRAASAADAADAERLAARHTALWATAPGGVYRFFIATTAQGEVLATLGAYTFGGVATEIMSARTALADELKVPAQDYLHWEMFRILRDSGARAFNLAGYSPNPGDEREAGIARFKRKWGGREVRFRQYARDRRPLVGRLAARARTLISETRR